MLGKHGTHRVLTRRDLTVTESANAPTMHSEEDHQCPLCGATMMDGRWQWNPGYLPALPTTMCPACQRIAQHSPAGELLLSGRFVRQHASEIEVIASDVAANLWGRHPMERLMAYSSDSMGRIEIATTGTNLALGIVEAVDARFNGRVEMTYAPDGAHVTIHWSHAAEA